MTDEDLEIFAQLALSQAELAKALALLLAEFQTLAGRVEAVELMQRLRAKA